MPGSEPVFEFCAGDCAWFAFEGGAALHHRPSGKTHFLNESGRLLLAQALARPATAAGAAAALARLQGAPPSAAFVHEVAGLISRFEEVGLVQRF
jgi:PqqD family protein of HPr-rel-A system